MPSKFLARTMKNLNLRMLGQVKRSCHFKLTMAPTETRRVRQ
jgi:hypothetical protein